MIAELVNSLSLNIKRRSVPQRQGAVRPKYDLWTLRKNDSSTPKNVPQSTNEHTCNYVLYITLLICLR